MQSILVNFLSSVSIVDWLMGLINMIPKVMYFLCVTLMSALDALQYVLRKLAGLDSYFVDGTEQTGDLVLSFLRGIFVENSQFPALKNAFWSLVVFGVILLIITTIIAIIRQEYMPSADDKKQKPSNNKSKIIATSVKSLFLFLIVPVSCIFGLLLSDVVLYTLDSITAGSTSGAITTNINTNLLQENQMKNGVSTYVYYDFFGAKTPSATGTFSGAMFKTAAFEANRVRNDKEIFVGLHQGKVESFGIFNQSEDRETCALMIDEAFAYCVKLKNPTPIAVKDTLLDGVANSNLAFSIRDGETVEHFSKFNVGLVFYYYNLWQFNFLIGFAFLIISIKIFFNVILGLMKRIFEMVALFIVSPPIVAIMPLDNGKAFADWRKNFISKALGVYGAIIGMNVLFLILPYLQNIQLFDPSKSGMYLLNLLIQVLFVITGLTMVQSFMSMLGGLVGGEDVAKAGGELASKVGDTLAQSAKMTGAAAGLATAPYRALGKLGIKFAPKGAKALGGLAHKGANKLGSKITGKEDFEFFKDTQVGRGMKLAKDMAKMLPYKALRFGGNRKGRIATATDWENGGAESAYNQFLNDSRVNQGYIDDTNAAYLNRSNKYEDMNKEDWLEKTAEGIKAKENAIVSNSIESFDEFKEGVSITKDKRGKIIDVNVDYGSEASSYFAKTLDEQTLSHAKNFRANLGRGIVKYTALENLATTSQIYFDHIKGGMVAGGKGGFNSMIKAFQGMSAKKIEEGEMLKKVQKEEKARVQAQDKARKQLGLLDNKVNESNADIGSLNQQIKKMQTEIDNLKKKK